ncbi:PAS domain-containing sensor histidine kinase [Vibrio cidicii]|uniref:Sensory histidine kinase/phosphatase NtrB n=1 Tax=Vibrio cidicii TaxID=1763883 RepID=A0A151KZ14_9VIBR|nr:nitrogen regulation protein NR(II) [Vibrio cidicii]ELV8625500.1 nitrogen regulation protein NR(II) [Vibrio cidicii]KYN89115.1 PAS domain-containing sensor histidine kinase [Vibrio cidicii]KYN90627.1 PAS domain-containing sensor histidine kinase [Vibrio cidicii]MBG0754754.1 two-component system sensor histidine kinase NtrB [Vibrio cidicii]MBG0760368.1 two-component system sensor histidine kinase NtrB [Vibrio cidicii]
MNSALSDTILSNMVTATLILDDGLQVKHANPAAEQLFAQSAKRIIHQPLSQLIQHASLDLALLSQPLQSGQSITDNDVTFVVDGKPLLLEVTVSPISIEREPMLLVEMRKVDQQRRITQEMNQHAQQQAAKLLVRGLAHEIKNPLGGLRGAAQLLEKMLPDPSLTEYTQIIIEQADRLRTLVDRLLGPQKPGKKQEANLHQVLEKVRQLVELESQQTLLIERDYDPSLPDIYMDADQIEQAMLNIVSNAAQVLANQDDGLITIRTRTVHQANIHGHRCKVAARIEIIDNGPGIPVELQDTLFYPMVSGREGGTGLGLSISQNLIDQHNGKIDVESWPGHTNFTIYLPI